jgi:hypothetical protein
MKTCTIKRIAETDDGTFGVMLDGEVPFALTLERQWLNNKVGESCIPAGDYECKRIRSPRFGNTFEVTNVPGRSHILFHKGNLDDDSHGCILIGEMFGKLSGNPGILASRQGFEEFMNKLEDVDEFSLKIVDL